MKKPVLILCVPLVTVLLASGGATQPPRESPATVQDELPAVLGRATFPGPARRFAEPPRGPAADRDAAREAIEDRSEAAPPPASMALAKAVERLRGGPAPPGEVYALVKVTDRHTGERRVFARGTPSPEVAVYLADPDNAPGGTTYDEADEVQAEGGIEVAIRSIHARVKPMAPAHPTREEERERDLEERNRGGGLSHRIEQGLRGRIERGEIDLGEGDRIPVSIQMKGVPRLRLPRVQDVTEGGLLWVGLEAAAAREEALIRRKKRMRNFQQGLLDAIERDEGRVIYASWGGGSVRAEVPAWAVNGLLKRPDVFSIDYAEPQVELSHRYRGDDYYVATDSEDFDAEHDGRNGLSSKHDYTSRIVLALGESCLDLTNPAWLNAGPGSFVRGWFYDCDPAGAGQQGGVEECSGSSRHGTRVAQLMTGDFMQGQDPDMSNARRRVLTGTCPECRFFFLQDQRLNQREKVLDAACDLGVDILESSIGSVAQSCDGSGSYDGTLESTIDCDVTYVQAAGNEGSGGGCTTVYPGDHPWTFTVGGMQTQDPCNTSGAYYTSDCVYDSNASRGGATYDGDAVAAVIDLTGPYRLGNLIRPGTRSPVDYGNGTGTSYATPIVAGLMAEFMDWWHVHVSDSLFFSNRARAMMLLFGDRSSGLAGTSRLTNDFSTYWGAGRVGLVPFDDKPTWSLKRTSSVVDPGDAWSFSAPVSPSATFFKAVVWHDGTNYSNEPMIRMTLDPQGCANPSKSVNRLDNKTMLLYTDLDGCTSINVTVENILAGFHWSRRFHFASYSDTEDERHF